MRAGQSLKLSQVCIYIMQSQSQWKSAVFACIWGAGHVEERSVFWIDNGPLSFDNGFFSRAKSSVSDFYVLEQGEKVHSVIHSSFHSLILLPDMSPSKRLLFEAVRCWNLEGSKTNLQHHHMLAKLGFKQTIPYNCAECCKGWEQRAAARPGLDIRRWDFYIEYLRVRKLMP